jgi:hypothetical protein
MHDVQQGETGLLGVVALPESARKGVFVYLAAELFRKLSQCSKVSIRMPQYKGETVGRRGFSVLLYSHRLANVTPLQAVNPPGAPKEPTTQFLLVKGRPVEDNASANVALEARLPVLA